MREKLLLDVPHRQVVFTIPKMLRVFFKYNRSLISGLCLITSFPAAIHPVAISLAAALALISVFFVGLLLDLLGSYLVIWELDRFKNYLKANEEWLATVVNKHKLFVRDDFDRILTEFGEMFTRRAWAIGLKVFIFWKTDNLKYILFHSI